MLHAEKPKPNLYFLYYITWVIEFAVEISAFIICKKYYHIAKYYYVSHPIFDVACHPRKHEFVQSRYF